MDCDAYRDRMLDLLYAEGREEARRDVERHQASCDSCREEMAAFRRLRRDLASWTVPAPPRRRAAARAWPGLAAAAAVLAALGTAAALGGAEVRRDAQGWSLRVGRGTDDLAARVEAQEARHRAELAALRAETLRARSAGSADEVPAAVRDLLRRSEQRQDERLREALLELNERSEAQRRYDLAQVSAGLSYLEGKAGLHAARTTELVGQVLLASQEK